jgi:hypothetical protein
VSGAERGSRMQNSQVAVVQEVCAHIVNGAAGEEEVVGRCVGRFAVGIAAVVVVNDQALAGRRL